MSTPAIELPSEAEPLDACAEHWRMVRLGLAEAAAPHEFRDDGPEALRDRARGLVHAAWDHLRAANDLLRMANEADTAEEVA